MTRHVLPIQIDATWFVLDALCVEEIVPARSWVPIPGARADTPGVMPWRGKAVTVLDLATLSEELVRLAPYAMRTRVVVLHAAGETVAAPVHAVREVRDVPARAMYAAGEDRPPHVAFEIEMDLARMPLV